MTDDGRRDQPGNAYSEESLDRLLSDVGPLMGRQERAEATEPEPSFARPDPAFERALRARLFGADGVADDREIPTPHVADAPPRDPREREVGAHPARRGPGRWYQRPGVWAGLAAALVALLIASVFVAGPGGVLAVVGVLAFAAVLVVRARLGQ